MKDKVIKKYNEGQREYNIPPDFFFKHYNNLRIYQYATDEYFDIGFYEWLFNPKYKVFEVFKLWLYVERGFIKTSKGNINNGSNQPEQILKYLAEAK